MAATAQIRYYTGAASGVAGSDTIGTTIRYNQGDTGGTAAATVGIANPIPLDSTNTQYSFGKWSKVNFSTTPAGSITNLRWFATSIPANCELYANTNTTYAQAVTADLGSLTNGINTTGNSGITGLADSSGNRTTNACSTNRTSASPLVLNAGGTILTNPTTGEGTQDFVHSQFAVTIGYVAGPGATTNFTITYRYAET